MGVNREISEYECGRCIWYEDCGDKAETCEHYSPFDTYIFDIEFYRQDLKLRGDDAAELACEYDDGDMPT